MHTLVPKVHHLGYVSGATGDGELPSPHLILVCFARREFEDCYCNTGVSLLQFSKITLPADCVRSPDPDYVRITPTETNNIV